MSRGSVSVIGLGLIGGSLIRAADAAGWKVRSATRSEATAAAVRDAGFDVTTSLD
ncbi:MAG: NAD(P)-binding domain-containing protein, partial [Actinomycetota bacterium]|nr:NAD(P)-binding domain-containing protein [Actinomycetota bacterium]